MSKSTSANAQITDAVTQSNVSVIGNVPAMALSPMYQAFGHSISLLFESTASSQRQLNSLSRGGANQGVMQIYTVDTLSDAVATVMVEQGGEADHQDSLSAVRDVSAS